MSQGNREEAVQEPDEQLREVERLSPRDKFRQDLYRDLSSSGFSDIEIKAIGDIVMSYADQWASKMDKISLRSFFTAAKEAFRLGVQPTGRRSWLILRWDKDLHAFKVCLELGYMAMIDAAKASDPRVRYITSDVIRQEDEYEREKGDTGYLRHKPGPIGKRGEKIGAYAVVVFKEGGCDFEEADNPELEKIRHCSESWKKYGKPSGPQQNWEDEMDKKAMIKRLCKRLLEGKGLQSLVDYDNKDFNPNRTIAIEAPKQNGSANGNKYSHLYKKGTSPT